MNKYKRTLEYIEKDHTIIAKWHDRKDHDVVLVESVKDCVIFNDEQDCRYTLAKAMDPWTHHIMVPS